MAQFLEKTCRCINDLSIPSEGRNSALDILNFHAGREYQVDVYPLFLQVYQNGGYNDYVYLEEKEFLEHFEMIE